MEDTAMCHIRHNEICARDGCENEVRKERYVRVNARDYCSERCATAAQNMKKAPDPPHPFTLAVSRT